MLTAEQIPDVIELETKGEVWAKLPVTSENREQLARACNANHLSLSQYMNRWLVQVANEWRDIAAGKRDCGGAPLTPGRKP